MVAKIAKLMNPNKYEISQKYSRQSKTDNQTYLNLPVKNRLNPAL